MKRKWLTREFPTGDLEVRNDGRTVHGLVVPFDSPTTIRDDRRTFTESFARGAFADIAADRAAIGRVKLLAHHDHRSNPLGRAVNLREDPGGLYGEFRVSDTVAGNEVLTLIKDGALDAFSIGFSPVSDDWNAARTEVVRRAAKLREVSLVVAAAYSEAQVAGVRFAHAPSITGPAALQRQWERERQYR